MLGEKTMALSFKGSHIIIEVINGNPIARLSEFPGSGPWSPSRMESNGQSKSLNFRPMGLDTD